MNEEEENPLPLEDNIYSPSVAEASDMNDEQFTIKTRRGKRSQSSGKLTIEKQKSAKTQNRNMGLFIRKFYMKIGCEEKTSEKKSKNKYKCKKCDMLLGSLVHFHNHYINQHFEGLVYDEPVKGPPYQCPKCEFVFKRHDSLLLHCAEFHNLKIKKRKCIQPTTALTCLECNTSFDYSVGFVCHQRKKHNKQYFMCHKCGDVFLLKSERDSHKALEHSKSKELQRRRDKQEMENSTDDSTQYCEEIYYCRECNYRFNTRRSFTIHRYRSHNGHRKYDCKDCEENFVSLFLLLKHLTEIHKESIRPEEYQDQFTCLEPDCGYLFHKVGTFKDHQKKCDHTAFEIACANCELTFQDMNVLEIHRKEFHRDLIKYQQKKMVRLMDGYSKVFKCTSCKEIFEDQQEVTAHKKQTAHTVEPVYKCTQCPLSYPTYYQWSNHYLVHRDICKDYQCETCGRKFNGLRQYRHHCRQHIERDSGVRSVCEMCGKSFSTRKLLGKHMGIIHFGREEKECHLCGNIYKTKFNFNLHMKVHEKNGILRKRKKLTN